MKKLFITLLLASAAVVGMAQDIGEAFYIYRNDGQFNAFFCEDVDSIAYSYYDTEGNCYDEVVSQVVYTRDSVFLIPLAAVDSVAFKVNDIKVSQDYVSMDSEGYTIVSANIESGDYVLLFNGNVPGIRQGSVMTIVGDSLITGGTGTESDPYIIK